MPLEIPTKKQTVFATSKAKLLDWEDRYGHGVDFSAAARFCKVVWRRCIGGLPQYPLRNSVS